MPDETSRLTEQGYPAESEPFRAAVAAAVIASRFRIQALVEAQQRLGVQVRQAVARRKAG